MRLVFISSVTAMTPLRTISVTTGSVLGALLMLPSILLLPSPRARSAWRGGGGRGGRHFLRTSVGPPPRPRSLRSRGRPSPPTGGRVAATPLCSPSSSDLDHQIAEGVALGGGARQDHRGRGVLLDQRRAFDPVSREQLRA